MDQYLQMLFDLEVEKLFITDQTDLLKQEIFHNCIYIPLPPKKISPNDLMQFLSRVKRNRQKQLSECHLKVNLIYYLWFDELAGQLRFNFINSRHTSLPFGCPVRIVKTEKQIVNQFFASRYTSGIPLDELEDCNDDQDDPEITLDVFVENLDR